MKILIEKILIVKLIIAFEETFPMSYYMFQLKIIWLFKEIFHG
jgi:hypothetical protein